MYIKRKFEFHTGGLTYYQAEKPHTEFMNNSLEIEL